MASFMPMKLIRHGEIGREEPGVLLPDGRRIDASEEFNDYDEGFFAMGEWKRLLSGWKMAVWAGGRFL